MQLSPFSAMPDLAFPVGESNAGGLVRMRLIPAHLVQLLIPERFPQAARTGYPPNTVSSQHLTFLDASLLTDVKLWPAYCSFSDSMESGPGGSFFRHVLQLVFPKVRPDVVNWVQINREVRFLAFIQDRNGVCRMAGTPAQPLAVSADSAQPMGFGKNQTVLTFTAMVEQPAFFLTGVDDADLFEAGPFSEEFAFSFDS